MIRDSIARLPEIGIPDNPFPGLRTFELEESHLFFGREGQSEKLIAKLERERFLTVVGVSGSGKSSLVRAGLLPALLGGLMASAGCNWRIAVMRPGNSPISRLASALNSAALFSSEDSETAAGRVATTEETLRRGSLGFVNAVEFAGLFQRKNVPIAGALPPRENLLLVVDQFEEIFRFAQISKGEKFDNEATAFVKLLLAAIEQRECPIYVVLTMRSDYLGDCAQFRGLPEAINEAQFLIPRLTRDEQYQAITGPIAVAGRKITPRLVNRLLGDVGDNPDQLPILQHALMRAWDAWKDKEGHGSEHEGDALDLCCYEAIGGMADTLSLHADEAYDELPDDHSRVIAENIFKCLTEKGPDNREIRRPVTLREVCAVIKGDEKNVSQDDENEVIAIIETFRKPGRSFLMPPADAGLSGESLIDISHESLIRNWKRLRKWVDEEARSARIYQRVAETAVLHRQKEAALWHDPDLQIALDWRNEQKPNKTWARRYHEEFDLAMNFLDQSSEAVKAKLVADQEHQKHELWKARIFAVVLGAALLLIAGFAFSRYEQSRKAQSGGLAAYAMQRLVSNPELSFQLSAKAVNISPTEQAIDALRASLPVSFLHAELRGHSEGVNAAAFSPDGKRVVTAGHDRTARIWEASTGREISELRGHTDAVSASAFSPDGKWVVTASSDRTARVWEVASNSELIELSGHSDLVNTAAFSPDGKWIVTASKDRTARVWESSTGRMIKELRGHSSDVYGAVFNPDGTRIVTASGDLTARVWNAASGDQLAGPLKHSKSVNSAAFSPDGNRVVTASDDNTSRVWDVSTGQQVAELRGHSDAVNAAGFSPDGKWIVTASNDNTSRVWELSSKRQIAELRGHSDPVHTAAFSPDGKRIVTASNDGTARIWEAAPRRPVTELRGHASYVYSAAFSPDGKRVVTASSDQSARIWDASTGRRLAELRGHSSYVYGAAFSPDNKWIVTAGDDGKACIWNASASRKVTELQGHSQAVNTAAFSPDSKWIVTASSDRTARVWEAASGRQAAELIGHFDVVHTATFSPDGRLIVSASSDRTARLWEASSGRPIAELIGHDGSVNAAAFSPDGRWVVTASNDRTARIWEVSSGRPIATLSGHSDFVINAAFSPDGKWIVTASRDRTARIWEFSTSRQIAELRGHSDYVLGAAFSPDGKWIVTASWDNTALIYPSDSFAPQEVILETARRRVLRNFTEEEYNKFGVR